MSAFKRILVPIDGSENSDKALQKAIDIALVCQSELHLLYVSLFDGDTDSKVEMISWLPDAVAGSVTKASSMILAHAKERIPANIVCMAYTEAGIPAKVILQFAEKNAMDLIVIGGRGLGTIEGFLLGSVSQSLLENAKCPVMIVK